MLRRNRKGQGLAEQHQHQQEVTVKALLEAGAHFGHQTHRWNPKMKRYIFEARNGIYIIDLAKTLQQIRKAVEIVQETIENNQTVLFVGTKKQAKAVVRECAEIANEFYIAERWLGGALTNLSTIRNSIKKLERIEKRISAGGEGLTKKEISLLTKDQIKLEKNLGGIRGMRRPPGLLIVVDPGKEHIAVAEANKLGIPVMGLVDTNCDPDPITHVIPCNDDALKSIKLILQALTFAIVEKKRERRSMGEKEEESLQEDDELALARSEKENESSEDDKENAPWQK